MTGGRVAADIATHDKYDAWAEDILIGTPQTSPHYFDLLSSDHREHMVHRVKDILIKVHKDSVVSYSYHTISGWYAGIGLSSMRLYTVSQHEVQPTRLLFLNLSENKTGSGTLFVDGVSAGYKVVTDTARGKAEVCICNGLMIRGAAQWMLLNRPSWKLLWHLRGTISSTIDIEAAVADIVTQRLRQRTALKESAKEPKKKTTYKEEVMLAMGLRAQVGRMSFGAEYQFTSIENIVSGARTPLVVRQPLPKVVTPATAESKVNDLAASSAARAVLPNDLVLELPSAAEEEKTKEQTSSYPKYYTPMLPEIVEQHRMLFDVTYAWENWRICVHYQTGASTYTDSVGLRVSYHF